MNNPKIGFLIQNLTRDGKPIEKPKYFDRAYQARPVSLWPAKCGPDNEPYYAVRLGYVTTDPESAKPFEYMICDPVSLDYEEVRKAAEGMCIEISMSIQPFE